MKNVLKAVSLASLFIIALAGANQTYATPQLSFGGNYSLSDNGGVAGFNETITFFGGEIYNFTPSTDAVFLDATDIDLGFVGVNSSPTRETIAIAPLTLDEYSYTPGVSFDFTPTFYAGGFKIFDDGSAGGGLLLSADLTVTSLDVVGAAGYINSAFSMNLTNITSPIASGTSELIDAFTNITIPGGATTISLQFAGNISDAITGGTTAYSTFSGTAAPVPEPGTVALLGMGLAGLVGTGAVRRKKLKKSVR